MTTPRTMDSFGPDEMAIPQVKLVQNVGTGYAKETLNAKPGDFYFSLTDEVIPQDTGFDIILVDVLKTRTFWGRAEIDENPPECSSLNGETSQDGKDCATCEHFNNAPWLLGADERRKYCLVNYDIIAIKFDTGAPMMIRTHGISCQSTRELVTQLKTNRMLKGEYHKAKIHVASAKKTTAAGEAFYFRFKVISLLEGEEAQEFLTQSQQLLGTTKMLPVAPDTEELAEMLSVAPLEAPAIEEKVTIEGIVETPPELSFTPSGIAVCNFKLKKGGLDVPITAWESLAERCAQEFVIGMRLRVTGKIKITDFGTEVVAKSIVVVKAEAPKVVEAKLVEPVPPPPKPQIQGDAVSRGVPPPVKEEPPAPAEPPDLDF